MLIKQRYPSIPYIVPFATFLLLIGIGSWTNISLLWLYPIKTIIVGGMLIWFWKLYPEIKSRFSFLAIPIGLLVFILWIIPEGYYPLLGEPKNISPYELAGSSYPLLAGLWICFRLFGAVVVVPIIEELFWRSFLLRYIVNPDFKNVSIGKFSWQSFIITVLLFGVEHYQWLPGIIAGVLYTLLLYRTKSLFACIIAHSITNLILGIYVLATHQWFYW